MSSSVREVTLGVEDQQRAKAYWTNVMGFAPVRDAAAGGERRLAVRAPDRSTILAPGRTAAGPGDRASVPAQPAEASTSSGRRSCDDMAATHVESTARGVAYPPQPERRASGWWSLCTDTEGNRFALTPTGQ
jgi:predicted enzyme related to lactoylglutathione lyase